MTGERTHRGLHRMSRKVRRSLGLSQLEPRGSSLPSNARCTFRGMLAAAAATAGLCGLVAAAPAAGAQEVRGLVIGIDDYAHIRKLAGAVNDARDIGEALAGLGVDDLTVLLDGDATRARILDEWNRLLGRAAPGDTLVLTYAGHGWQEPERVPGTEDDGKDEAMLLGGFRETGHGTRERIVDDELNQWFLDASRKALKVVFVADACHSGTLTRSIDPRAPALTYRNIKYTGMTGDMLALDLPEEAADTGGTGEGELAHVSKLAAALDHETVPEIELGGEMRGALSYLFARALRGEADVDGDGALRRDELWGYVRENVRMVSEARQTPSLEPRSRPDEVVLRLAPAPSPTQSTPATGTSATEGDGAQTAGTQGGVESTPATAGPSAPAGHGALRLAVLHAGADTVARARETLAGVRIVPKEASPDLLWDARERQVVTRLRDVAAHDVGLDALPGVVEKWEAVHAIREISARNALGLRIAPGDGMHRHGSKITVRVEGLSHPRLTVFSLSGNGVVHYLYPQRGDDPAALAAGSFELPPFKVTPPYGADHVVAVSAGSALDGLNAALRRLDGQVAAGRAVALLAEAKARANGWSSGIQGLYTAP